MLQFGNISFDSILWFCASGKSFFLGLLFLVIVVIIPTADKKKWKLYAMHLLRICALILVVLASTPLHPLFYLIGLILLIGASFENKKVVLSKILFISFALLIILLEIPFYVLPSIPADDVNRIYIIGDSVSAGMGNKDEQTWPILLEKEIKIKTINLSVAGATAKSALKQSSQISDNNCLVILEIGGNDLLGHTSVEEFETSCNELLNALTSCEKIIWFELPLLPQHYPYGRIQRELAKQYGITLASKSILANVFNAEGATSDGIHLTQKGHTIMALEVQQLFQEIERRP